MKNGITKKDFIIGSIIAFAILVLSIGLSSGYSLIATFVPGIIFSWALFAFMFLQKKPIPRSYKTTSLLFATIGIQLLLFAEEAVTGFNAAVPTIYGGEPYSYSFFIVASMIAYFILIICSIFVFIIRKFNFLLFPILLFVVAGTIGSAISHSYWGLNFGSYFPGLIVSQLYWIIAPLLLVKFIMNYKIVGFFIIMYMLALIPILKFLMVIV